MVISVNIVNQGKRKRMDFNEYLKESARTMAPVIHPDNVKTETLHGIIGVASEAGELLDAVKKSLFYGQPLDLENIREESGDILWYLAAVLRSEGWNFEEIMQENIDKLKLRYPEQFSQEAAYERADKR